MYFPYLRGKQYELLAIRNMADDLLHNGSIVPIIEPVNTGNSQLISYSSFAEKGLPFIFITNPAVGDPRHRDECASSIINLCLDECDSFYPALLVTDQTSYAEVKAFIDSHMSLELVLIYKGEPRREGVRRFVLGSPLIKYHIFLEPSATNSLFQSVSPDRKVVITDGFIRQGRNADYSDGESEYFGHPFQLHLHEGLAGFGDYSIVGEEFLDGGWSPRVVAIHHINFHSSLADPLYVTHYVSDDKEGTRDISGKFMQALEKLVVDLPRMGLTNRTFVINEYLKMYETKSASGLGKAKELAIRHHLELMLKFGEQLG